MRLIIPLLFLTLQVHAQEPGIMDLRDYKRWTVETKTQKEFYRNGNLKKIGVFKIYKTDKGVFGIPVKRHVTYRRNGSIKRSATYSPTGIPMADSIYKRDGSLKKIRNYIMVTHEGNANE